MRRTLVIAVVCAVAGFASCAQRSPGKSQGPNPSLFQIPGIDLRPQDDIDAADLAVTAEGAEGDLHAVWRAVIRKPDGTTPGYPVLYARGERGGQAWSRPVEIDALGEPPRIALASGTVHVLFGPKLRHFTRGAREDRETFRELAPLVPAGRTRALAFDVSSTGGGLLAAYLLEIPAAGAAPGSLELHVAAIGSADRTVARFPSSFLQQAAPRLIAAGGRLHLLCAVNLEEGSEPGENEPFGKLLAFSSGDGGATWTQPAEVAHGRLAEGRTRPPVIQAVDLVSHQGTLFAFYSAFGLWASRSADGRAWSAPTAVAAYETSLSRGSTESASVAAVSGPNGAVLSWIDTRFRKSDRRWWNPLGGVPWSDDDPFWANNDVFALTLNEIGKALAGHPVPPRRLTPPQSFARSLRAATLDGRTVLLWAGRLDVGKRLEASRRPPALFYTTFSGNPAEAGPP